MEKLRNILNNYNLQENPPEGHLKRFEEKLDANLHRKKITLRPWQGYAAVAITGIILLFSILYSEPETCSGGNILSNTDEEYVEAEFFLIQEIDHRIGIIDTLIIDEQQAENLLADISEIDYSLCKLKKDLVEAPGDQRIINAVLNTYMLKIEALDYIVNIIQKYS